MLLIRNMLQWGHRLSAMETRFNGATAFRRWKRVRLCLTRLLQWGHRLSAMETSPKRKGRWVQIIASMGPPPFGDGNEAKAVKKAADKASMGPPPFGDGNATAGL